ncbi:putative WRKY transcription factor 14 [Salvia divinorum]|uniref:WRKY transcription factor 14 n=1 Tax=Salvia divinorum TaxID=28513 RepID=A0ABD1IFM0_SALDI
MMENNQGDLANIVRATTTVTATTDGCSTPSQQPEADWQYSRNSINYPPEYCGDPFTYITDPLIQTPPTSQLVYNSNPEEIKRPSNIFSRMLEISPNTKPCESQASPPQRGVKNPPILVSNSGGLISGLQISSPRNTGIKRRKSQAKKVVCIPAAAPANSRASGEVVPSDLWAWRKYGQKPIKGSPFPRGYYRCSSSKGCSARKQVERSQTDPNMLVITYTSEHNHPWPTQRNALAGSTRSQPAKNTKDSSLISDHSEKHAYPKNHDHKETSSPIGDNCGAVKEEVDNRFEAGFNEGFSATYKLALEADHDQDSFFADLGEIGDDPLSLFGHGFPPRDDDNSHSDLDPFNFYDWAIGTTVEAPATEAVEDSGRKS